MYRKLALFALLFAVIAAATALPATDDELVMSSPADIASAVDADIFDDVADSPTDVASDDALMSSADANADADLFDEAAEADDEPADVASDDADIMSSGDADVFDEADDEPADVASDDADIMSSGDADVFDEADDEPADVMSSADVFDEADDEPAAELASDDNVANDSMDVDVADNDNDEFFKNLAKKAKKAAAAAAAAHAAAAVPKKNTKKSKSKGKPNAMKQLAKAKRVMRKARGQFKRASRFLRFARRAHYKSKRRARAMSLKIRRVNGFLRKLTAELLKMNRTALKMLRADVTRHHKRVVRASKHYKKKLAALRVANKRLNAAYKKAGVKRPVTKRRAVTLVRIVLQGSSAPKASVATLKRRCAFMPANVRARCNTWAKRKIAMVVSAFKTRRMLKRGQRYCTYTLAKGLAATTVATKPVSAAKKCEANVRSRMHRCSKRLTRQCKWSRRRKSMLKYLQTVLNQRRCYYAPVSGATRQRYAAACRSMWKVARPLMGRKALFACINRAYRGVIMTPRVTRVCKTA